MPSDQICIVIPCYNEAVRFPADEFMKFATGHAATMFCLVNDGSTDGTKAMLASLHDKLPDRILICDIPENKGKAEAVRTGVLAALRHFSAGYIGYFDADLSSPLDEAFRLQARFMEKPTLEFCFGSRMAIVGVTIRRKLYRHLIGRIIATFISNILHLVVYDTQCGTKLFRRELAGQVFEEPFLTRWLFDVEIFARIIGIHKGEQIEDFMLEVPVSTWIDKGGSKIGWTYGFRMFFDLYRIRRKYRFLHQDPANFPPK
jgi:dolichyl-phosphate beta-glucosyltransferase